MSIETRQVILIVDDNITNLKVAVEKISKRISSMSLLLAAAKLD